MRSWRARAFALVAGSFALAAGCGEGTERDQKPFTTPRDRDASVQSDGGAETDGSVGLDAGGGGDRGTVSLDAAPVGADASTPTAPEVDPACTDGRYSEPLPTPSADISAERAAYTEAQAASFIDAVLDKRYPVGSYLVENAVRESRQNCVDTFLSDKSSAAAVLGQLSTIVHECGHFLDLERGGFSNSIYVITPALILDCRQGDTTSRGGRTFARSLMNGDGFASRRPPCNGRNVPGCDDYADVYLDGDPNNATFEGGDQGFNSVLEETVQYVNSLATGYALNDIYGRTRVSERDGIATFLWYVGRYLRLARTDYPAAYDLLARDTCWRNAILTVWGRAWLMLGATANLPQLGIEDAAILQLVRDPEILGEIERLRTEEGCP